MKKALLLGFILSVVLPEVEASPAKAAPVTKQSAFSPAGEKLFKKRRRNRANRRGGFLGIFGKKKGGCGCPNN